MPHPKRLDHAAILADHAAGMSRAQLAAKYQAHKSTIRWHLMRDVQTAQSKPESAGSSPNSPAAAHNGATIHNLSPTKANGHASSSELEQLVAECWSRLPLAERLKILLARV